MQLQEYEQIIEWEDNLRELRETATSDDVRRSLNLGVDLRHIKCVIPATSALLA